MARCSGKFRAKRRRMPLASWLLILAALLSLSTGAVVAYLSATTGNVENKFVAAESQNPEIQESMSSDGLTKSDVAVKANDPGYAVYVRAAVLVNWKKGENGDVWGVAPVEGTDYSLKLGDSGWFEHGGFYYYSQMVPDGTGKDVTSELIEAVTVLGPAPEDRYTLNVEIIAQTIQAIGTTDAGETPAVTDAWGVYVDENKKLTLTPP